MLILVLFVSISAAAFVFFKSQRIEDIIPNGIPAVVAIVLLSRQKKPKEKKFNCSRRNKVAEHDARTIKAWNNGFLKLYCMSTIINGIMIILRKGIKLIQAGLAVVLGLFFLIIHQLYLVWVYIDGYHETEVS